MLLAAEPHVSVAVGALGLAEAEAQETFSWLVQVLKGVKVTQVGARVCRTHPPGLP